MRIAIYARYSSELQNPKSTSDQIADCKRFIAQTFAEYDEPVVFYDDKLSGQYEHTRTQFLEMKDAIRAQKFDVIVAEGLDRLARDSVDNTMFYRICTYRKVRILTIQEGEVDVMKGCPEGCDERDVYAIAGYTSQTLPAQSRDGRQDIRPVLWLQNQDQGWS